MTELDVLIDISGQLERVEFLLHACATGVGFCAAALFIAGWLYARRDSEF